MGSAVALAPGKSANPNSSNIVRKVFSWRKGALTLIPGITFSPTTTVSTCPCASPSPLSNVGFLISMSEPCRPSSRISNRHRRVQCYVHSVVDKVQALFTREISLCIFLDLLLVHKTKHSDPGSGAYVDLSVNYCWRDEFIPRAKMVAAT